MRFSVLACLQSLRRGSGKASRGAILREFYIELAALLTIHPLIVRICSDL